ncbi:MAG: hypothetical protein AAGD22_01580 [Verrucomicrobiota bacterium]
MELSNEIYVTHSLNFRWSRAITVSSKMFLLNHRRLASVSASLCILCVLSTQAPAAAPRVLYLGDSLSMGSFGRTFDQRMRESNFEVYTFVTGGGSPYYWLSKFAPISSNIGHWEKTPSQERRLRYTPAVPKIETLLQTYRPSIVVVQTGINLYSALRSKRRSPSENVSEVSGLIDDMCRAIRQSGAEIYWIAPPHSHEQRYPKELQNQLLSIMKSNVHRHGGMVFESGRVTHFTDPYPQTDGIHYGPTEAAAWAEKVAMDFTNYASAGKHRGPLLASTQSMPESLRHIQNEPPPAAEPPKKKRGFFFFSSRKKKEREAAEAAAAAQAASSHGTPSGAPLQPRPSTQPVAQKPEVIESPPPRKASSPTSANPHAAGKWGEVELKLRLGKKSTIEHPNEVTYNNAFAVYEYQVLDVQKGSYPYKTIRVAHMIMMNRKPTFPASFKTGKTYYLTVVPISSYPALERVQMIDQLPLDLDLPIFITKL